MCFAECTTETEELYKMHRHTINDAVFQVLKKLVRNNSHLKTQVILRKSFLKNFFFYITPQLFWYAIASLSGSLSRIKKKKRKA